MPLDECRRVCQKCRTKVQETSSEKLHIKSSRGWTVTAHFRTPKQQQLDSLNTWQAFQASDHLEASMVSSTGQVADEEAYKRLKEAFVSDHYGSTVWEINKVLFVAPVSITMALNRICSVY